MTYHHWSSHADSAPGLGELSLFTTRILCRVEYSSTRLITDAVDSVIMARVVVRVVTMNHTRLPFPFQSKLVLIYRPWNDKRLSWPGHHNNEQTLCPVADIAVVNRLNRHALLGKWVWADANHRHYFNAVPAVIWLMSQTQRSRSCIKSSELLRTLFIVIDIPATCNLFKLYATAFSLPWPWPWTHDLET